MKALLDQLKAYDQGSLQDKIEAYVIENIEKYADIIRNAKYSGFILNSEITGFTGPNLSNKFDNGSVFLIPAGKAYLRNDFFEYHLFGLKEEIGEQMSQRGFPITIQKGSGDLGIMPCLKIEKIGVEISYDGANGYSIKKQSQEPVFYKEISDVRDAMFKGEFADI